LACNLSQEVNGVSWLHGEVSKEILGSMWPGYFKDELHIGYVTNGVHYPTWTAGLMRKLYNRYFPEAYSEHQYNIPAWQKVHNICYAPSAMREYCTGVPNRPPENICCKVFSSAPQFMNLGKTNAYDHNEKFSMSFLACNLSQEVNDVMHLLPCGNIVLVFRIGLRKISVVKFSHQPRSS
ncbi:hypothetical protein QE152_g41537, partial [Popillia japonica]